MTTIISILSGIAAIIGASYASFMWITKNKESIFLFLKSSQYGFFYPQSMVKTLVTKSIGQRLVDSEFIDYSLAVRNGYYENDTTKLQVRINDNLLAIQIPYKVVISYIEDDTPKLKIQNKVLTKYDMPQEIKELSEKNFNEFISRKPNTFDGKALRVAEVSINDNGIYECKLESATYFDQVRTNLTIDLPISTTNENTMRTLDLSNDHKLRPFSESILANTIGVCAIWYTSCNNKSKHDKKQFFLKLRKTSTGIYYDLLGTISGVVEPPVGGVFDEKIMLEEYLRNEILREFYQETGYDKYMMDKGLDESVIKISSLAFTRDLTRGGKPQFFFAIHTPVWGTERSVYEG